MQWFDPALAAALGETWQVHRLGDSGTHPRVGGGDVSLPLERGEDGQTLILDGSRAEW